MQIDRLIKRKEILSYLEIKDTKLRQMINTGKIIKPIIIVGFQEELYTFNELQIWISDQKEKRDQNNQEKYETKK